MSEHPRLPIAKLQKLQRIVVHKHPHLDEYMAALLFRAILPPSKSLLPFEEFSLSSTTNDQLAQALWPHAAVFGISGTHDGGATPLLEYDEHVAAGQTKRASSLAKLVMTTLFPNAGANGSNIDHSLVDVVLEVDFIDSYGNAHGQHLGNCIKRMHAAQMVFSPTGATQKISGIMSPGWKQAVVEASLVSLILAKKYKERYYEPQYWLQPALDSLHHYAEYSPLKNDTFFQDGVTTLEKWIEQFRFAPFKMNTNDGNKIRVKAGNQANQCLIIFFLAALLQRYWGPVLGQIMMSHYWEVLLQGQLTYIGILKELDKLVQPSAQHSTRSTPYGEITFIDTGLKRAGTGSGPTRSVWILEIVPRQGVVDARSPLTGFINKNNVGVGYVLLRARDAGNNVLSKGKAISQGDWETLCDQLIALEGNSNENPAGCWHRTQDNQELSASFLLNGNAAHQYVPKSQLSAVTLAQLLLSR